MRNSLFSLFLLLLAGCASVTPQQETPQEAVYTPTTFAALPNWTGDDLGDVKTALLKSCTAMRKKSGMTAPSALGVTAQQWQQACDGLEDATDVRAFIEQHFKPFAVTANGSADGLFTGYYEKQLHGSLTKSTRYNVPLYKRPPELVMVDLGLFRPALKGERIAGKVVDGYLKPYADRAAIDNGALAGRGLELAWVDDADAAFFLHVQGSGEVALDNGETLRVGYDGQNGHVYNAIGRELIARGELTKDKVSLQTIRDWLKAHPNEAPALRQKNPSYVFFRKLDGSGPVGAQGVELTAMRSLAVDPRFMPYGAPVWLDIQHPQNANAKVQRLVIAQDTGGAIRGPVRGDFFWGNGAHAEEIAGVMKSPGRYWVLLPRTVTGTRVVK